MLDRQPVLEGERLLLRPLRADDWDALFAVASDPLVWQQHPAHDRWREPVFCAFFDDALANKGALVAIDRASDVVIGSSRFEGLEEGNGGSVEIGWTFLALRILGRRLQSRNEATDARPCAGQCSRMPVSCRRDHPLAPRARKHRRAPDRQGEERVMAGGEVIPHVTYVIKRDDFAKGPLA